MDVRTLFFTNAVADVCMLLALSLYLCKRKTYPGFHLWAAATLSSLTASLSFGLRGLIPDPLSITLGVTAYPLTAVWRLSAMRSFLGLGPASAAWYALPLLSLILGLGLAFYLDLPQWRTLIVSLASAIPGGCLAYLCFRHAPRAEAVFHRIMGVMLALLLTLLMVRALLALLDPGFHLLQETTVNRLFPLALFCTHLLMNIFFLMLNGQRLEMELLEAQAEIKTLGGLLPICANCKSIRDDKGYWEGIEAYLERHSEARFTHGLCPACMRELYPEVAEVMAERVDREGAEG